MKSELRHLLAALTLVTIGYLLGYLTAWIHLAQLEKPEPPPEPTPSAITLPEVPGGTLYVTAPRPGIRCFIYAPPPEPGHSWREHRTISCTRHEEN